MRIEKSLMKNVCHHSVNENERRQILIEQHRFPFFFRKFNFIEPPGELARDTNRFLPVGVAFTALNFLKTNLEIWDFEIANSPCMSLKFVLAFATFPVDFL